MSAAPATARVGRPRGGARERLLEAAIDVLKEQGYAGMSVGKVADRAGESKALIAYHFGSKQGLVLEVGRLVAERITTDVLGRIEEADSVGEVVRGVLRGADEIAREDPALARLYFDLAAVSIVEPEIKQTIAEITGNWRGVVEGLLSRANDAPPPEQAGAMATLLIAASQGLALERIERGDDPELEAAQELLARSLTS